MVHVIKEAEAHILVLFPLVNLWSFSVIVKFIGNASHGRNPELFYIYYGHMFSSEKQ